MKEKEFVHLHVHTEYSLLDGMCRIDELLTRAKELGMYAIAITDHGNMFGAVEFYRKALEAAIKPIIGCELYVAPGSRFDKKGRSGAEAAYHLVVLAENEKGYANLIKLSSLAYLEGFYYRPRVDKELLAQYSDGLIGLSACLGGEIPDAIIQRDPARAERLVMEYSEIFGADNFFLELMDNGIAEQRTLNPKLVELARKCGVGVVASNDCHYIDRTDAHAHEVLLCIQTQTTMADESRLRFATDEFYLKAQHEMAQQFESWPDSLENAAALAHRCTVEIPLDQGYVPKYEPPDGSDPTTFLKGLVETGLVERYGDAGDEVRERAEFELDTIDQMGFATLFLLAWDVVSFARKEQIPVGPGRGSAAASVVSYTLGITNLDPIRYGLVFERFLNPDRVNVPDFDIDFSYEDRGKVLSYISEKHGRDNVAQIITFGTMAARAAIRDAGRALNLPYATVDRVAKLVPAELGITLESAIKKEPELRRLVDEDEEIAHLWGVALSLEGLVRHASTHAAGVIICDGPVMDYVPVCRARGDESEPITTQYSMGDLEAVGLAKLDILGLRTLTVIDDTLKLVKETRDIDLSIEDIPLDDKPTFELIASGETTDVFQLESSGMRDVAKRIGLESIEEIIALVALYRPGPMIMLDDYVTRKHDRTEIKYDHPLLEPILKETYGIMVYQEQVIEIAHRVGDFGRGRADMLRRAMAKKDTEEMARSREEFVKGAAKKGVPQDAADRIFSQMDQFSGYGFNKAHSASYGLIAYQTAYLKCHFPAEFNAATLSSKMDTSDKIAKDLEECRRMAIDVLPPDVNESDRKFGVSNGHIRFGLGAVKNVGAALVETIVSERKDNGAYSSVFDFCSRVDFSKLNKRALESLIKAGAFASTGAKRSQLMEVMEEALREGQAEQKERESGQISLFGTDELAQGISQRFRTLPDVEEWPQSKLLTFEKETLGFYLSGHPFEQYSRSLRHLVTATTQTLGDASDKSAVVLGGVVAAIKVHSTRKNELMAFLTIEDLGGTCEVVVFSSLYAKVRNFLAKDVPVVIQGRVDTRDDIPKLVASEMLPAEEAESKLARAAHVAIESAELADDTLAELKKIVLKHSGPCALFLHFAASERREITIRAPDELAVAPSRELAQAVGKLLGNGSMWFSTGFAPSKSYLDERKALTRG